MLNFFKLCRFPISIGSFPDRELNDNDNDFKVDTLQIAGGITPVNELFACDRYWRFWKELNQEGTFPLRLLMVKFRTFNLPKWDSPSGNSPWKLFLIKSMEIRNERFHTWGWIVPVRPMFEILRAITLWWRELQVTPIHWQTEDETDQLFTNIW